MILVWNQLKGFSFLCWILSYSNCLTSLRPAERKCFWRDWILAAGAFGKIQIMNCCQWACYFLLVLGQQVEGLWSNFIYCQSRNDLQGWVQRWVTRFQWEPRKTWGSVCSKTLMLRGEHIKPVWSRGYMHIKQISGATPPQSSHSVTTTGVNEAKQTLEGAWR